MINLTRSLNRLSIISKRRIFYFSKKKQQQGQNSIFGFVKDAWRQTFPNEQDEIRRRYKKVKQQKRYTKQELQKIQQNIPQYQRTSLVQVQQKEDQEKKGFKVSNMIPEDVKKKIKQSETYHQYSQFRQNLKQFVTTSDNAAIGIGNKAYTVVSQPSKAAQATQNLRKYDKDFSLFELQKQSTFIFRDTYQFLLQENVKQLQKISGDQALEYFKSVIKVNKINKVKPKFNQILNHNNGTLKQTVMKSQDSLPSFVFQIKLMQIYCMVNYQGQIVDGDQQRIMSSTYHFILNYSGQHIQQLGHPWKMTQIKKVDQIKLLV